MILVLAKSAPGAFLWESGMIHCALEPLPIADENALRSWLNKGAYEILFKVIEAQVKRHQTEYLKFSLESSPENNKAAAAALALIFAQRYDCALDVLREIANKKDPYQIAKLS